MSAHWAGREVSLQICGEKGLGARDTRWERRGGYKGKCSNSPASSLARCGQAEQVDRRASWAGHKQPAGTCTVAWTHVLWWADIPPVLPDIAWCECRTRDSWPEPGYPRVRAGAGSRSPYTHLLSLWPNSRLLWPSQASWLSTAGRGESFPQNLYCFDFQREFRNSFWKKMNPRPNNF